MDRETNDALWKIGVAFVIAAFAGIVNYIQRFTAQKDLRPAWEWGVFLIKGITAGAVGIVTHWLLSRWELDADFVKFAFFVAGWGGAETVVLFRAGFEESIRRWAGAPKGAEDAKPKD